MRAEEEVLSELEKWFVSHYNIMIRGLCKESLIDEAVTLFSKMKGNGCLPNAVSYETVIRALLARDENEQAPKLLTEMISKGLLMNNSKESSSEWIRVVVFDLDEEDTPRKDSEKKTKEKKATVNEESKGGKESGVAALSCIDKLRDELSCAICLEICFEPSTTPCGHRRFIRAAQGVSETPSLQLECLTKYIAELSLLEASMLCYAPSLIAASAIFLAKFILSLSTKPWNATLKHYTQYQPSNLCSCVRDLCRFCCNNPNSNLPAITEKYSQHKYENVAKKYYPPSIPSEYFQN